jgi:hypothetical protein
MKMSDDSIEVVDEDENSITEKRTRRNRVKFSILWMKQ